MSKVGGRRKAGRMAEVTEEDLRKIGELRRAHQAAALADPTMPSLVQETVKLDQAAVDVDEVIRGLRLDAIRVDNDGDCVALIIKRGQSARCIALSIEEARVLAGRLQWHVADVIATKALRRSSR